MNDNRVDGDFAISVNIIVNRSGPLGDHCRRHCRLKCIGHFVYYARRTRKVLRRGDYCHAIARAPMDDVAQQVRYM